MGRQLLVLADRLTPRLRYVAELMLGERLGLDVSFREARDGTEHHQTGVLRYGATHDGNGLFIRAHGLLDETGIRPVDTAMTTDRRGMRVPMGVSGEGAAFDFDPLAAAFHLLTRYEEHLPYPTDAHARFDGRSGLAFREGFHQMPVVDIWTHWLRDGLRALYPDLQFRQPRYRFTPTIDIDNAFAYRHKGWMLNLIGAVRSLARGEGIGERIRVLSGRQTDPYDNYAHLTDLHRAHGLRARYFLLLADRGRHDRNLPHDSPAMQQLARDLSLTADLGIHPGYAEGQSATGIRKEAARLEKVTGKPVTTSRHHFIRISLPKTYQELIAADITDDCSMGHHDITGFRAGTADSFPWYDLTSETVTPLRVHPFACMDVTLRSYLGLTPDQALSEIARIVENVREVGGHLMTLWHNESVRDQGPWQGWERVHSEMLRMARP